MATQEMNGAVRLGFRRCLIINRDSVPTVDQRELTRFGDSLALGVYD